jgi:two-component system response regulator AtoC
MNKILILDDEENIRIIAKTALSSLNASIDVAKDAAEAWNCILENTYDVIVSDIRMPGMDGIQFLQKVKAEQPAIQFLMMTAHGSMDTILQAMRGGASDFLQKPFDLKELRQIVAKLLKLSGNRQESIIQPHQNKKVIGDSPEFVEVMDMAIKASPKDVSILVLGESGTGKEVLAKEIHENSKRQSKPFIAVNCGAIPENLMESELFGFEQGAFTGAMQAKPGKVELAEGGTLFLDEIGEMPLSLQVKLLRVIQERKLDRVGSVSSKDVDFRLIAATHKDLPQMIKAGTFREDLYYRLNVISLKLPALRKRGSDIVHLAHFFLDKLNQRYDSRFVLNSKHKEDLLSYPFPGNIRELENIMERAVVLSTGNAFELMIPKIEVGNVPEASIELQSFTIKEKKQVLEKEMILVALEKNRWNKTKTAASIGMSRRSLLYKIKSYDIS